MIFKIVWVHLRNRPFTNLLTLLAIAFCLGLLGGFWSLSDNLRLLHAAQAAQEGELSVFVDSTLTPEKFAKIDEGLKSFVWIDTVQKIDQTESLKMLREKFGDTLVSTLTDKALPITLKIKMKGSVSDRNLQRDLDTMKTWDGVIDVDLGGELWSGQLSRGSTGALASWSNLLLFVVFVVVILLISHITRIAFEGSREDVRTLSLMGASKRWIFAPLLVESCVMGVLGSCIGLFITVLFLKYGLPPLTQILFGHLVPIQNLSWIALWKILGLGVLASIMGAMLTWPLVAGTGRSP